MRRRSVRAIQDDPRFALPAVLPRTGIGAFITHLDRVRVRSRRSGWVYVEFLQIHTARRDRMNVQCSNNGCGKRQYAPM